MQTPCAACPFRMAGPPIIGAAPQDIAAWVDPANRWTCHGTGHAKPCAGAESYHAGASGVTESDLLRFWIDQGGVSKEP